MTTTNRDALLKTANLVRPALSTQSFIPALTHIRFADGFATAYNDVMAIGVKTDVDLEQCVPGELFIRALSSFNTESIVADTVDDTTLLITAGRSKLKLPVLPVDKFPFEPPKGKPSVVELTDPILQALNRCLFSVGTDPTHPAQMGVTLQVEGGKAVAYSTDNFTISRAATKSEIKLPGDAPIILPTAFCEQLLAMAKAFPEEDLDLHIYPGALFVKFGKKAWLLTKTVVDLEPLDFEKIVGKHFDLKGLKAELQAIPDTFDSAWNRALLVLSTEADKATKVTLAKESAALHSRSEMGEATDTLLLQGLDPMEFYVDPTLVVRAAKTCGAVAFYKRALVLATDDASFAHLIAHCAA